MSADLVLHRHHEPTSLQVPTNIAEIKQFAEMFAKSGYFQDAREMAQAAVKIIAGAECGVKPFAAMNGIYIVKSRTTMSANLMATLVKTSGRYNYKIVEITGQNCRIDFYENGEKSGESSFSRQDAVTAGTQNLDKFARNMLFARAMSNGVRWFCPDVTAGPVYTPEELGEEVDGEGEMLRPPVMVHSIETVDTTTGEITQTEQKQVVNASEDPLTARRLFALKTFKEHFVPDAILKCLPGDSVLYVGEKIHLGKTFANMTERDLEAVEIFMATPETSVMRTALVESVLGEIVDAARSSVNNDATLKAIQR